MPRLRIPPPYRGPTRGEGLIEVNGTTLGECLEDAEKRFPGLRAQVLDADQRPHRFVQLFLNGEPMEGGLEAPVGSEDEIQVLAAIGGG